MKQVKLTFTTKKQSHEYADTLKQSGIEFFFSNSDYSITIELVAGLKLSDLPA